MLFALRRALGIVLIIIGLAALFTPLTPGSWLALIGLELLGIGFLIPATVRTRMNAFLQKMKEQCLRHRL